jgi:hypothetical protein
MKSNFPSRALDKFVVRLPAGMRDQLAEAAQKNNRTMNAEIVSRLEASLQRVENEEVPDFVSPFLAESIDKLIKETADTRKRLEKLERPKKKTAR